MGVKLWIKSITVSGNKAIALAENDIAVIVGPNNSGKSTLLREINEVVREGLSRTTPTLVVSKSIDLSQEGGDQASFDEYIAKEKLRPKNASTMLCGLNLNIHESNAKNWWINGIAGGFHGLTPHFCCLANASERLGLTVPPPPADRLSKIFSHPIHILQDNDELQKQFNQYCMKSFGKQLMVNYGGGNQVPLHIGTEPQMEAGEDRVSTTYFEKMEREPLVHLQGDGIKSFIGCLLATKIANRAITLLDEPEAFLHPPQAKILGQILANEQEKNQLLIATHSVDILRGMLDTGKKLQVLRMTRNGNVNDVCILNAQDIKEIWSDPILRYSNILDGLFHEGVVLCEADADCHFYELSSKVVFGSLS